MTDDRRELLTVPAVRQAVDRLIKRGMLTDPTSITIAEGVLVLDIDDHVSDETIGGGRVRTVVVIRKPEETRAIARALADATPPHQRRPRRR